MLSLILFTFCLVESHTAFAVESIFITVESTFVFVVALSEQAVKPNIKTKKPNNLITLLPIIYNFYNTLILYQFPASLTLFKGLILEGEKGNPLFKLFF